MTDVLMLKWGCIIEQKAGCGLLMMPSSFTKEGGAYEYNGNFDIGACDFFGPVLHR